jgi:hypothetical protein
MHFRRCSWYRLQSLVLATTVLAAGGSFGCSPELSLLFNFSSLGGSIPGRRAQLNVKFVNQTPYRPVFTFGTYDPLNVPSDATNSFPLKFNQFVIDTSTGGTRLDAFSESDVITFQATKLGDPGGCGRAISLGGEDFIKLIEKDTALLDTAHLEALRPLCNPVTEKPTYGIAFFRETSAGPAEDACETKDEIVAFSEPMTTLQGNPDVNFTGEVVYPCDGGTVIFTFVEDSIQAGGIRIRVTVEPPVDTP